MSESTLSFKHNNVNFERNYDCGVLRMAAPQKEETIVVRLAVPTKLYAYLRQLRLHTSLGASESDVARFLLTQRIEKMIEEKYLDNHRIP
jgi:hypothetical protein